MTSPETIDPQPTNPLEAEPTPAMAPAAAAASDTAAAAATPPDGTLEARLTALEAELAAAREQHLRALAEVENVRRRAQREREDTAKYAVSSFAKELVTVADNLRRALDAVPAELRSGNEILNNLTVGVEATERQLAAAFERAGIKRLEPLDQPFDPNFHQVVFEVENTGKPAGTVIQVLQAGYTIHGRLLREAMVGVAKGGAAAAAPAHLDTTA